MKNKTFKILSGMALTAMLALPAAASASEQENGIQTQTQGKYTALQKGERVYVSAPGGQLYETKGPAQLGKLKDLFVIFKDSPVEAPLIVVETPGQKELKVFSDLWWKFNDGTYEDNRIDAYDSGRIFYEAKDKIVSKTAHHYAVQEGNEVSVMTANNYDDLSEGFHESYRVDGTLRGLVIYDCCPYVVVENNGVLSIHGHGDTGLEQFDTINLNQ
ncbi:hypothetical protein [Bacillus sp. FJAT-29814]|uniref:hypothetical protein n=1 Tax=Bacillus sp. FJAT-29814 TaxID=1729688 RepID=UPI000831ACAF|nr:hypothetical protein [Bacillus sp. FJAT-29814]